MSTEELMKPRYKVIADYPGSEFIKGKIVVPAMANDMYAFKNGPILKLSSFPSLFKPLAWWEERDEKDMPDFVKIPHYPNGENDFTIVRVDGVFVSHDFTAIGYFGLKYRNGGGNIASEFTPSTESEYNEFINQNK